MLHCAVSYSIENNTVALDRPCVYTLYMCTYACYTHGHTVFVHFCITYDTVTVEPSNKGHFGTNISFVILSFLERLSFSLRFKIDLHVLFVWVLEECSLLRGAYFGVSTIECFTVHGP